MNTPANNDERLQAVESRDEQAESPRELDGVSKTQRGLVGLKYDSGLGWQYC